MKTANEWIQMIHKNAVDHGWWEKSRTTMEIANLINSEWSEALEEDRAGHPPVWMNVTTICDNCLNEPDGQICCNTFCEMPVKGEGVAVELADGVIRIFDWLGSAGFTFPEDMTIGKLADSGLKLHDLQELICWNTVKTASFGINGVAAQLIEVAKNTLRAIDGMGLDPEEVIAKKHRYNVTRPYKHGKNY